MKRTEIEELRNKIITSEQFDEIMCSEFVTNFEYVGLSSSHPGHEWWSVTFDDGEDIDVFVKL